jgi:hypothetical protein
LFKDQIVFGNPIAEFEDVIAQFIKDRIGSVTTVEDIGIITRSPFEGVTSDTSA